MPYTVQRKGVIHMPLQLVPNEANLEPKRFNDEEATERLGLILAHHHLWCLTNASPFPVTVDGEKAPFSVARAVDQSVIIDVGGSWFRFVPETDGDAVPG